MPRKPSKNRPPTLLERFCGFLPDCDKAMDLVDRGMERPLKGGERLALRYHSRTCPFCGCNELKVRNAIEKLRQVEADRQGAAEADRLSSGG